MRRLLIATLLAIALIAPTPTPARAGIVGFASEFTQVLNYGKLVDQYIRQGRQLAEQLRQTTDMIRNSQILTAQIFGPIMNDIQNLASVVQGGRALAYSMANLDAQFRQRFQGYAYHSNAWYTDYQIWSETALDTTRATLRAAGLQSDQLINEQTILDRIRVMAETSGGRMEALQVANQIAEQEVQQLMKLRELMLADLQSKQAFQAQEIQKDAATQAAAEQFFQYAPQASAGRTFQAGWK